MTGFKKHSIATAAIAAALITCLAAAPAALAQTVGVDLFLVGNPDIGDVVTDDFDDNLFAPWFDFGGTGMSDADESDGELHLEAPDFVVLPVAVDLTEDVVVVADIDVTDLPVGLAVSLVVANNTDSLSIAYFGDVAYLLDQTGAILGTSGALDPATTVRLVFVQPADGEAPFAQVDPGTGLVTIVNTATAMDPILFVGFQLQDGDGDGFSPPEDCDDADGGVVPGTACDDGNACTEGETCSGEVAGECGGGSAPDCSGTGDECNADNTCDPAGADGNCDTAGGAINNGGNCGDAATECSDQDTCDTGVCQTNDLAVDTSCGDAGAECTVQDTCDGAGTCDDNGFVSDGTDCGASATECSDQDTCDGAGTCQANDVAADTDCGDAATECSDQDACDGAGGCQANDLAADTSCGDAGTDCVEQDTCDGAGACSDNGFVAADTSCGAGATECSAQDTCDGAGTCQVNDLSDGTSCGDTGTDCVVQDTCDGAGTCDDNGFVGSGTDCGDGATDCSDQDTCDGAGTCQTNDLADDTACDDGDACNIGETCQSGTCAGGSAPDCSGTGDQCNSDNTCDPGGEDGNCDIAGGANNEGGGCDDGDGCTSNDACTGGACLGDDFVPDEECFLPGACAAGNVASSCVEGDVTDCATGTPTDEVCDDVDNDCNDVVDDVTEDQLLTFYEDRDVDGFGNPDSTTLACTAPKGFVDDNTDCNDNNADVSPGADEVCDGLDNNCDGQVDGPGDVAESTLYSVSRDDDILRSVNPATGETLSEVRITMDHAVIQNANGLVYDPVTHTLTALLNASVCEDGSRTVNTTLFDDDDEPTAAGIDFATCERFDGDESGCLTAFQSGRRNLATSCWYDSDIDACEACNPGDEEAAFCTNSCVPPVCPNDPSRTIFAGGPDTDACWQFSDDEESCNAAFHRGRNGVTSCFYDDSDNCKGCGPNNLRNGDCVDTCGGLTGRLLVTIDHITGEATLIGDTRDRFAGLAVDKSGRLLGVTGDGAIARETLFDLNRDTAFPTLVTPFGNGEDGEVIATQPFDNFLYHGGGCCGDDDEDDEAFAAGDDSDEVFERWDLGSLTATQIPVGAIGEPTALVYWVEKGVFIWANFEDLIYVTPDGEVSFFIGDGVAAASGSFLDHDSKGLAFVRDVTGSDCDANGALDSCDLQVAGNDVNGDGVLDVCVDEPPVVTPPGGGSGPPPIILTDSGAADDEGNFAGSGVTDDDELLAELTVSGAVPGTEFDLVLTEGTPTDEGFFPGGTFAGFANGAALSQTLTVLSDAEDGTFAATIAIYFNDEDFAASGLVPSDIEVHVLDETAQKWAPAGTDIGNARPPADAEARAAAIGQSGFFHDDANERWCFWTVVDHFSTFAVGTAEVAQVADLPDDDVVIAEVPDDDGDTTPPAVVPPAVEPPAADPAPTDDDDDGDGVANADDLCLRTEAGTVVDADGCPLADEQPPTQTEPTQEIECGNGVAPCGMISMLGLWGMLAGLGLMKFARPRVRRKS